MRYMKSTNQRGQIRYQHTETVTDATSDPLGIPPGVESVAVIVSPGTSASVQVTCSSVAAVDAATATWMDWPSGSVAVQTADAVAGGVTAIRLVSTGASTWDVSA